MIEDFGTTRTGRTAHRITLAGGRLTVHLLTLGAALQDLRLAGHPHSLTVGSRDLAAYEGPMQHCGTIMGPVANRIAGARATVDGRLLQFDRNFLGRHTLHGGSAATHRKLWTLADHGPAHATLTLTLPDGEGGFPGSRRLGARFALDGPTLRLTLDAETDAPTPMNLANHSYWNLGPQPTTAGHRLTVHAGRYLPSDAALIPTGEIADVTGTRFDYRSGRPVEAGAEGLVDTNFCLADARGPLRRAATLTGPGGLAMDMATTEPGLQVFDGHILGQPDCRTTDGAAPVPYAGLALEAQFWPDAPNHPDFPAITLRPGQPWRQVTTWTFRG